MQYSHQMLHESKKENTSVLVFKSNIKTGTDIETVKQSLDEHPHIIRWNVDQQDIDNVLRIETTLLQPYEVERLLSTSGFYCQELPD